MSFIRTLVVGSISAVAFGYAKKWLAEHPDAISEATAKMGDLLGEQSATTAPAQTSARRSSRS